MELKIDGQTHTFHTPQVMGIINISPDSYYSKSRYLTSKEVFCAMQSMIEEGAAIIDIGAASSRPGAVMPTTTEEWARLAPIFTPLRRHFPNTLISIDTMHSITVERVYDLIGPFIINDISAGEDDPRMFSVAARWQLPVIAMHKRGTPQDMQLHTDYTDVAAEVRHYFALTLQRAQEAGVPQIILDPGFGFAKTTEQNYTLLAHLPALFDFPNVPRMIGISRKSMIYKPLHITADEALPASSVLHFYALQQGVDILRVHDVAEAVQVIHLHAMLS